MQACVCVCVCARCVTGQTLHVYVCGCECVRDTDVCARKVRRHMCETVGTSLCAVCVSQGATACVAVLCVWGVWVCMRVSSVHVSGCE